MDNEELKTDILTSVILNKNVHIHSASRQKALYPIAKKIIIKVKK